jgi:hypothetical protein
VPEHYGGLGADYETGIDPVRWNGIKGCNRRAVCRSAAGLVTPLHLRVQQFLRTRLVHVRLGDQVAPVRTKFATASPLGPVRELPNRVWRLGRVVRSGFA